MKSKGFTLIELLVVIAIIALLGAIIAPAIRKACSSDSPLENTTEKAPDWYQNSQEVLGGDGN